jgi:hypothetical protein
MNKICFFLFVSQFFALQTVANTWLVGPGRTYTKPSQVATLVQNSDTVLIDAGVYPNDVARWTAHNLVIKGVGGLAHLKSGGLVYGGKAIWVIVGNDVTVENMEFSEATCPDRNGAGIRSEGINLTLRACYFHHNEDGILAGDIASGDFLIEYCEFAYNGYSDGLAHNLYINHANSVVFRYNYSHDAKVGHEFKSRAYQNFIYCNRFSDENGTSSRSLDLPNGGFAVIVGNLIVQDQFSENNNIIGYGLEGANNPNSELYLAYNTLVNNKSVGSFIQVANGIPKIKAYNNIFAGAGNKLVGTATVIDTANNLLAPINAFDFVNPGDYNFRLAPGSMAVGTAISAGTAGNFPLAPSFFYVHPAGRQARLSTLDIGAFETSMGSSVTWQAPTLQFSISPNPASDHLQISPEKNYSRLQILDYSGRLVVETKESSKVSVANLPKGLYLICVWEGAKSGILPFLKQ